MTSATGGTAQVLLGIGVNDLGASVKGVMSVPRMSAKTFVLPGHVYIQEVAPRDGWQIESCFIPTEDKIRCINALSRTGLAQIEVSSFVAPKFIPMLHDAEQVFAGIERVEGVRYAALVANLRGAERAVDCAVDDINLVMSASESHNRANMRMDCELSLAQFASIMQAMRGAGTRVNGTVATAFGCPFEGDVPIYRVLWAIEQYLSMGMHSVVLADTTGMADPALVQERVQACQQAFPGIDLGLHFHNTRGMGLANVLAALTLGVSRFDAALGGIGGCPYAPGASGNLCTEDLLHMLDCMGITTGIDLDALLALAADLPRLLGHEVPGLLLKAGKRSRRYPLPATYS